MEYNGIKIVVERKYNKNTYLRYKDNSIYVTTNKNISDKQILSYIADNFESISKRIINNKEDISKNDSDKLKLFGRQYQLKLLDSKYYSYNIEGNLITISFSSTLGQEKAIRRFYKSEIEKMIIRLENKYSRVFKNYNLVRGKLSIKKMSTRWGSCNKQRRSISINELLAKIDLKYLEYVLCHEYAHLEVANHSQDFYDLLEKLYPNHKIVSKELKSFSI